MNFFFCHSSGHFNGYCILFLMRLRLGLLRRLWDFFQNFFRGPLLWKAASSTLSSGLTMGRNESPWNLNLIIYDISALWIMNVEFHHIFIGANREANEWAKERSGQICFVWGLSSMTECFLYCLSFFVSLLHACSGRYSPLLLLFFLFFFLVMTFFVTLHKN